MNPTATTKPLTVLLLAGLCASFVATSQAALLDRAYLNKAKAGGPAGEVTFIEPAIVFHGMSASLSVWSVSIYDERKQKYPGDLFSYAAKLVSGPVDEGGAAGALAYLSIKLPAGQHRFRIFYAGKPLTDVTAAVEAGKATLVHVVTASATELQRREGQATFAVDAHVRQPGSVPLHTGPGALAALLDLLAKHPSSGCRWKAVEELRRLGDPKAVDALCAVAANDADAYVRHFAAETIESLRKPR
jgi:hypothetical protein